MILACSEPHLTGWPRAALLVLAGLLTLAAVVLFVNHIAWLWQRQRDE